MTTLDNLPENTPILVGAGQVVERGATADSPMMLASEAARRALAHAGAAGLAGAIDTISVTRLFTDSMGIKPCPFGRSDNPPLSVARAIGAAPAHCIYGQVGGNEPLSRLIEFAREHALKIVTIKDLVSYRLRNERLGAGSVPLPGIGAIGGGDGGLLLWRAPEDLQP